MNLLRAFCDSYLNVAKGIYEFYPYFPYVLLVVLDYGRMSLDQLNLGWVSQHEVLFEIPLGMWGYNKSGRWAFQKWVVNTPFIVVDNAASLTTGREAYGWPKVLAELQYSPERWLIDPRNPTRFLTLDLLGLDSDAPNVPLLEIDHQSGQNPALVPPDLEILDPFWRISRLTRTSMSMGFDLAQLFIRAPLTGFAPRNASLRRGREVLFKSLCQLFDFYGEPGVNVVTLKQFRDAEEPTLACYQALVESRLSVARFNRGGFLGLQSLLQGDVTGGFQIRLFDNPAFPIVASLGLEVAQKRTVQGRKVSFLEPVFPFWISVDLTYGTGKTLCWRTRKTKCWYQKSKVAKHAPREKPRFNTIAGGAEQVWCGPYLIPDTTYNVFPLEADPSRLNDFLNEYLNPKGGPPLKAAEANDGQYYVYLIASANRTFSLERSGAFIQASEVSFLVPLYIETSGCPERTVLVEPFIFLDNAVLAIAMREVEGIPAMNATITAPSRFLRSERPLLRMEVSAFDALGAGLRPELRTLLEILPGNSNSDRGDLKSTLKKGVVEPDRGDLKPILKKGVVEQLMLKQFRDAEKPDRACYQAVLLERWLASKCKSKKLPRDVKICIHRYPSLPLVKTLGLKYEIETPAGPEGVIVDVLKCVRPYKVRVSLTIELAQEMSLTEGHLPLPPIDWSTLKPRRRQS